MDSIKDNKVIAFTGERQLEICDHGVPDLKPDDVLVHIKATALCTQEQRFYTGLKAVKNYPSVAGHESAGEIVAVGSAVRKLKAGDKVAIGGGVLYANGGHKFEGEQAKRPDADGFYKILQGTLSRYVVRNEQDVLLCPQSVRYEDICLTEPVSCVLSSVLKADIQFGDFAVVLGCGIMGLLHVQLAKMRGAVVIASEIDPARKKTALECGADFVVDPKLEDAVARVKELTEGKGADEVFNTTAIPANWPVALAMAKRHGKIVAYSSMHPDDPIPISMGDIHSNSTQIIGTVASSPQEMFTAARLLSYGLINTAPVIDSSFPFEHAKEAFEKAIVPNTYRVIITD